MTSSCRLLRASRQLFKSSAAELSQAASNAQHTAGRCFLSGPNERQFNLCGVKNAQLSSASIIFHLVPFSVEPSCEGRFPRGLKNVPFCHLPPDFYDEKIVRQEMFTGGNKTMEEKKKRRKNNVEKWAPQLVFTKQLMLLAVGKKCSGPKPISRPPQPLYAAERRGFLTVSKKNIFKCVWLLNVNLHKRWMSSMVLHQQNAPLFQYAKWRLSPSRMSSGISKPQTEFSFSGFEKFELALGENFMFIV